jgi:hypothetical protein
MEDINSEVYALTTTREGINNLFGNLAKLGAVNIEVNKNGDIVYDIPEDSDLNVKPIDIVGELAKSLHDYENMLEGDDEINDNTAALIQKKIDAINMCIAEIKHIYDEKILT